MRYTDVSLVYYACAGAKVTSASSRSIKVGNHNLFSADKTSYVVFKKMILFKLLVLTEFLSFNSQFSNCCLKYN